MSLHTNLPIYKVAYDLLDAITDLSKNMPRDFKTSIGGKLRDECVEIVVLIFRANVSNDKAAHLISLVERLQVSELLLRLSRDKRLISTGQYAKAIELTINAYNAQANEPVAWLYEHKHNNVMYVDEDLTVKDPQLWRTIPLYAAPTQREWVGLSEHETLELWRAAAKDRTSQTIPEKFAAAIQAKLRELNTKG